MKDFEIPNRDCFDRFRGFLAMAIVWHHNGVVSLKIFNLDISSLFSFPGRITVWLFFVLSGYGIYYGYRKEKYELTIKESFRFYFNRAIRILPLF